MTISLILLAAIAIAAFAFAMFMKNAIHCVLALAVGLVGIAAVYLDLGAQFVGFAQVLVYVGAVSILAVFALMTTQQADDERVAPGRRQITWASLSGTAVAVGVFAIILLSVLSSGMGIRRAVDTPTVSAVEIGDALMHGYALPLEVLGLMLTASMVGAVIIAMPQKGKK